MAPLAPPAAAVIPSMLQAKGRISAVSTAPDGQVQQVHGSFELHIDGDSGQLMLLTPLGSTVAVLAWSHDSALLKRASGAIEPFASARDMIERTLGTPLSPNMLRAWLYGSPIEGVAVDSIGPGHFSQLGWDVSYERGDDGRVKRLLISRTLPQPAQLRLALDEWQ
ncbi:MAG: outer membrane lipoprotein LolB [Betaproteobacteria bacterium]|nr:outer membrane lipoprotein LolB [Betaproteobacteria bacterium]